MFCIHCILCIYHIQLHCLYIITLVFGLFTKTLAFRMSEPPVCKRTCGKQLVFHSNSLQAPSSYLFLLQRRVALWMQCGTSVCCGDNEKIKYTVAHKKTPKSTSSESFNAFSIVKAQKIALPEEWLPTHASFMLNLVLVSLLNSPEPRSGYYIVYSL